jgi:hypothetical protein
MTIRIPYSQETQTSKMLAQAINLAVNHHAEMMRVKSILDDASNGNDWTAVAAELGLTGPTANADAQNAWTIISTYLDALNSNASQAFVKDKFGELSRLDQG